MRLHRLELMGVGPFLARQEIDFDELSSSGLFLIDGPTGSGKTTIIDAIVFALFGDVSGGSDSDKDRTRSSYCREADPSGVLLEFTVDGRRHLISRVPPGARDPQDPGRAAATKPARQVLRELDAAGDEVLVLTKAGDIRRHVEDLLDMNADQFRQLVVLPQGRFADLLRMTPTERLTALSSLLDHDGLFTRIQEHLKSEGAKADDARRNARGAVSAAAQQLAGRLRAYLEAQGPGPEVDFTDATVSDEARAAAVDAILAALTEQSQAAANRRDAETGVCAGLRDRAVADRAVADAIGAIGTAQEAVTLAEGRLDDADVDLTGAHIDSRIGTLRKQEGGLEAHAAWESGAGGRAESRAELLDQRDESRARADALRVSAEAIPGKRADLEETRALAQALAGTRAVATAEAARLAGLVEKADDLAALEPDLDARARELADAEHATLAAEQAVNVAHETWMGLLERQLSEQAVRLARGLAAGDPCPVCGSIEHPALAVPVDDHPLVSDTQIDDARERSETAVTRSRAAAAALTAAREQWQAVAGRVSALRGALAEASPDTVRAEHAAAVADAAAADRASESLTAIADALGELAEFETALATEITECDRRANDLDATMAERDAEEQRGLDRVRAAIGDAPSATALLARVQGRIAALVALQQAHRDLDEAARAVPPDKRQLTLDAATTTALTSEGASRQAEIELTSITEEANVLASAVLDATAMARDFVASLASRRDVDRRTAAAVALAQLATGGNEKKLPLRSYALQRRFASVLAAATVHLERMSSGKFSFELSDEVGQGHTGLGIALHDAWTGHTQDPKSLSGGETFYAALSLALGLADVVRGEAGGSALETLFIDEGFGSLDQDTLYQVLDQLDQMRSGGRVVGVISYVTEMKESIQDRIEVRRGPDSTSTVSRPGAEQSR